MESSIEEYEAEEDDADDEHHEEEHEIEEPSEKIEEEVDYDKLNREELIVKLEELVQEAENPCH